MNAARYLAIVTIVFGGLVMLAALNAWAQAGAPTKHGWYTCSYIRAKVATGSAIASPKLVIVSGSNALMGIDTQAMANALSIHAFNFGLAASFGPGFQSFEATKILKPGDAVLMPFEYLAYDYVTPRDSLIDAVYSCGVDYWRSLDWRQKLFFVMAEKPFRLFDSLVFRSHTETMRAIAAQAAEDVGPYGQGRGNGPPIRVATAEPNLANHAPIAIRFDADSEGAHAIAAFVSWARAHRVGVFATWPSTLYYPEYEHVAVFAQIGNFYRSLGVEVVGAPKDAMFALPLMGDTIYHLNREGMRIRTQRLVQALRKDGAFIAWRRAGSLAHVSAK